MRGRVMGIWALVFGGMMPVGGMESGLLSHAIGVPWAVAVGAVICAAAGLVAGWSEPARKADGASEIPMARSTVRR